MQPLYFQFHDCDRDYDDVPYVFSKLDSKNNEKMQYKKSDHSF